MDKLSDQVILIVVASVFLLIVAAGIIFLVFIYQKRQIANLREKEQLKIDFERQILESKLEIQEQTLKNISQEIHDNIGQVLSLAKLTINTMHTADATTLKEKIASSKELVTKAIKDLRNLSKSLNTDYVTDMGLMRAIEYELEMLQHASPFDVDIRSSGEPYRLQQKQELIIFRIFQELLQNIIKHANASAITIVVVYEPGQFVFHMSDNGVGFDIDRAGERRNDGQKGGLGLRNLDHRAKLVAASFNLRSEPGKGTAAEIILPLATN